jgi:hypothetical protein
MAYWSVHIGRSCPRFEATRRKVGCLFPSGAWGQEWVKVYLYSPFMPSRRKQEQLLFDGPYFFLRAGVISCVEVKHVTEQQHSWSCKLHFLKIIIFFFYGASKGFVKFSCASCTKFRFPGTSVVSSLSRPRPGQPWDKTSLFVATSSFLRVVMFVWVWSYIFSFI